MRSGWAWFFAGTTIALAIALAALIWAVSAAGLLGQLTARVVPAALAPVGRAAAPVVPTATPAESAAPAVPSPAATPAGGGALPGATSPPPAAITATAAQRLQVLSSDNWKLLIGEVKSEPGREGTRKVTVDVALKNDSERADVLSIPATMAPQPRSRPASWAVPAASAAEQAARRASPGSPAGQPVQMGEPPTLQLRLYDRANRPFGGGFVAANGEGGGGFTFVAAPGDAIRLPFVFEVPSSSVDPLTIEAQFGQAAGGAGFRVALDATAQPPAKLEPSDLVKVNGKEQRYLIEGVWSLTLLDVTVGQPDGSGQRTVTARISAENLTDRPLAAGASENDPLGASGDRDFYVVDAAGRLAYSSSDSMPRQPIPAGATRTVDVRMKGYRDFATTGPFRFSVVVDPRKDQYAIFRTG